MYPEAQETHKYIRHMKYRNQIDRLYKDNSEKILIEKTIDESINSLIYDDNDKKIREIAEIIINNKIKSGTYKNIILDYINLLTSHYTWYFNEKYDTIIECMQHNQDLSNFYDLYSIPQEKFKTIISRVSIEEFYKIAENSYLTSIFNFNEIITESFLNCVDSQDYNSKYQNYINDLIADSYYIIESYSEGYAIPNEEEVERINEEICNKILADIKDDIKLHFSNLSILEKLNDDLDSICFDFSDSICETVKTIPDPDYIEEDENQDETDKIRIIFSKDNIK